MDNIQGLRDKVEDTREIHARIRYIVFKTMGGCQFDDNIQGLRDNVGGTREVHACIRYIDFKTMEGCQFEIIEELHTKFESSHLCTIQKNGHKR